MELPRENFKQIWTPKEQKWQEPNRNRRYEEGMTRIQRRTLPKKGLNDPDNQEGVITDLEPDILECEVKWALGSITMNKASGGDGIPTELIKILKDDAIKVLHSICLKIWKIQQWYRTGKCQFSFQSQRKAMLYNVQTTAQLHSLHMLSK